MADSFVALAKNLIQEADPIFSRSRVRGPLGCLSQHLESAWRVSRSCKLFGFVCEVEPCVRRECPSETERKGQHEANTQSTAIISVRNESHTLRRAGHFLSCLRTRVEAF